MISSLRKHTIDFIFVLLLFFVFALSSLTVVYIGSRVYLNTAEVLEENFNENTAIDYIQEKIRQHQGKDCIYVQTIQNTSVLSLKYLDNYTLYIYQYNGMLKELLIKNDQEFNLEQGEDLMSMSNLSFEIEGQLLKVNLEVNQQIKQIYIALI